MNRLSTQGKPAVAAENLGRRFGSLWALEGLSFQVGAGESLLVVGGNGAGKTTLLRLILGLEAPDSGALEVLGVDPLRNPVGLRRRIGALLHEDAVYPELTVAETLALWRVVRGSSRSSGQLLEAVGLQTAADRRVGALSAGMRKRLALARTLITGSDLVLWDEPLSSLDAAGREWVLARTTSLREQGATLLVTSHERTAFEALADRVLDLDAERQAGADTASPEGSA